MDCTVLLRQVVLANALIVALNGCEQDAKRTALKSDAVKICEYLIKEQLKAPSSYKSKEIKDFVDARKGRVSIEFDASNSYGAIIRNTAECLMVPEADKEIDVIDMKMDGEDIDSRVVNLLVGSYYLEKAVDDVE